MPRLRRDGGNPPVNIEAGAAYEFLMSLVTIAEVGNEAVVEVGPRWLDAVRERAGDELMKRLHDFSRGTGDHFIHLLPLVYDTPAPRGVAGFLEHLAEVDARELVLQMIGFYEYHVRRATPPDTIRAAVEGDRQAAARFASECAGWGDEWHAFVEHVLGRDPEATKSELLRLLDDWNARVWQAEEAELLPILERDAEAKRALMLELPFDRFVETATNGVQFVPYPGVERLVLVPSYVNRPWVSHAQHHGAVIMVYPVADESVVAEHDAPPLRLVRLTKALGDEKRLRILRALAAGPRTLVELAEQFDVPKTTMHHHMVRLRSAGLVTVGAGAKEYRLRGDALPNLTQMLGGYLATAAPPEAAPPATDSPPTATASSAAATRATAAPRVRLPVAAEQPRAEADQTLRGRRRGQPLVPESADER